MKRIALIWIALALISVPMAADEVIPPQRAWKLIDDLFASDESAREQAKRTLLASRDLSLAPALVELIFFRKEAREAAGEILQAFFGRRMDVIKGTTYKGWFELIGRREDIIPKEGYVRFKAREYSRIDPAFGDFLDESHPRSIRPEEIVFGGARKDAIPALIRPKSIPASEAGSMTDDEIVFGAFLNGEARAYPKRILDWHEMANDVIGGRTVSLAYCT
ncbi:MAG TPA: DUF3179 domain-containing (seleno)protein, partial [Thermoanaerobaculia bacterium]|nr:DUF3179 domain-containing (seleno)protein [Thermoanaerobaculia bacterium]